MKSGGEINEKLNEMNIYLLEQSIVDDYDTYDSCVVIADNAIEARGTHPSPYVTHSSNGMWMGTYSKSGVEYENDRCGWPSFSQIEHIKVTLIGVAMPDKVKGVVCSSFNAG